MIIKTKFQIPFYQYLNPNGELDADVPVKLSHETIIKYFRIMNLINIFDKKAIALQRTGRMGTYAPINGQESIGTAIGMNLEKNDIFVPYYRDYATLYQRNIQLSEILSFWGGDERSMAFSQKAHDLPICVPIASQCLHAAGVAHAFKYKNLPQIAFCTIGDGGTSEGDFYEALNVSGAWNLPVVFLIKNNQWAISVPLEKQTRCETLAQKAIAAGFEGVQVDGNDIFALHHVLETAVAKARNHGGPTLIEALSYRLSDHTTADDASRYQPADQVKHAEQFKPIDRLKKYILQQNILSEADIAKMIEGCEQEVEAQIEIYLNNKPQALESIFDYHFATLPDYLIEQRAEALEEFSHAHG
jgi:2-oxoisovalerate dehydrogenase E1 component alpha subunit